MIMKDLIRLLYVQGWWCNALQHLPAGQHQQTLLIHVFTSLPEIHREDRNTITSKCNSLLTFQTNQNYELWTRQPPHWTIGDYEGSLFCMYSGLHSQEKPSNTTSNITPNIRLKFYLHDEQPKLRKWPQQPLLLQASVLWHPVRQVHELP